LEAANALKQNLTQMKSSLAERLEIRRKISKPFPKSAKGAETKAFDFHFKGQMMPID
jgi:hypothetical protein